MCLSFNRSGILPFLPAEKCLWSLYDLLDEAGRGCPGKRDPAHLGSSSSAWEGEA